jgi:hypothetical protein
MGQSTNGQICYGIKFEEGDEIEFPWNLADGSDDDVEDWWLFSVKDFKYSKECYGDSGRLPGITDADVDLHYKERRDFLVAHPVPVELVNYCSADCPMYILAYPASVVIANRGYPLELSQLPDVPHAREALLDFCSNHGIKRPTEPKWWLSSYWG